MIGGAMIAEGGFGCVFHPAIPCSHDEGDEDEFISKIVKRDFNSDNEIQIADKIRKINKWRSYFNVVTNSCATEISEIDAKEREKCESFKLGNFFDITSRLFLSESTTPTSSTLLLA